MPTRREHLKMQGLAALVFLALVFIEDWVTTLAGLPLLSLLCPFLLCVNLLAPHLLPAWFVFAVGLFRDFLRGVPLGGGSLLLFTVWLITALQHDFLERHGSWVLGGILVLDTTLYMVAEWGLMSLLSRHWIQVQNPVGWGIASLGLAGLCFVLLKNHIRPRVQF